MKRIAKINFVHWVFLNFVVLALFGVVLRYMISFSIPQLNYMNILHAHSHFAFAGWVFLAFVLIFANKLPVQHQKSFSWIALLTILSSYGMLVSFSIQGYKLISIILSTLFLFVTYWFAYVVLGRLRQMGQLVSKQLIKASIWFLILSSVGPFALGFLKALGYSGVVYQNAIYFYLHFQLNGWMLLAALGLIALEFLKDQNHQPISTWLKLFIGSTLPLFFIFTLWAKPLQYVYIIAFLSALLHAISWFVMLFKLRKRTAKLPYSINFVVLAISLKVLFQVIICLPEVSSWVASQRNLIIGYLHLITLGCITPVLFHQLILKTIQTELLNRFYLLLSFAYVFLLFFQPFLGLYAVVIPYYQDLLFIISVLFAGLGLFYYLRLRLLRV